MGITFSECQKLKATFPTDANPGTYFPVGLLQPILELSDFSPDTEKQRQRKCK